MSVSGAGGCIIVFFFVIFVLFTVVAVAVVVFEWSFIAIARWLEVCWFLAIASGAFLLCIPHRIVILACQEWIREVEVSWTFFVVVVVVNLISLFLCCFSLLLLALYRGGEGQLWLDCKLPTEEVLGRVLTFELLLLWFRFFSHFVEVVFVWRCVFTVFILWISWCVVSCLFKM